jgi:beta-1,4-mannosyl-glycoprotein beta-1,4-N-acetylglucosaminyltransferase
MYLDMIWFSYNCHWKKQGLWTQGHVLPGHILLVDDTINFQTYRKWRFVKSTSQEQHIPNGGWHLTYFLSIPEIQNKLQSFAHQEYNKPQYKKVVHIRKSIRNGLDLYRRTIADEQLVPFKDIESLPQPIQKFHQHLKQRQGNITPSFQRLKK